MKLNWNHLTGKFVKFWLPKIGYLILRPPLFPTLYCSMLNIVHVGVDECITCIVFSNDITPFVTDCWFSPWRTYWGEWWSSSGTVNRCVNWILNLVFATWYLLLRFFPFIFEINFVWITFYIWPRLFKG